MKTVKIHHSIFTIGFTSSALASGAGMSNEKVDELVNSYLNEGYNGVKYDEVEVIPLKSNFSDSVQLESVVNEYIFRKYEDTAPTAKSK